MKTRVLAAVILLPLLLIILLALPGIYTGILFGLIGAIGAYELLHTTGLVKNMRLIAYCCAAALYMGIWSALALPGVWLALGVFVFACILYGELLASKGALPFRQVGCCLAAGLLIPYFLTAVARIRAMENGIYFILLPFTVAFVMDTGAYFTGRAIGKHKLSPTVSPNKTVEGVVGGVTATVIAMLLYTFILQLCGFTVNYLFAVIYGVVGSMAAVFGDLIFSVIKRQAGIKDYGNLIPGHGGALDRFDSLSVVAPLTELLLILLPLAVRS